MVIGTRPIVMTSFADIITNNSIAIVILFVNIYLTNDILVIIILVMKIINKEERVNRLLEQPIHPKTCGARIGDAVRGLHPFIRGSIPLRSTNKYSTLLGVLQ